MPTMILSGSVARGILFFFLIFYCTFQNAYNSIYGFLLKVIIAI